MSNNTPSNILATPSRLPRGRPPRIARATCPICHKPGVPYERHHTNKSGTKRTNWVFEHRDEPPISGFLYKGRQYYRYRRCTTRSMSDSIENEITKINKDYTAHYSNHHVPELGRPIIMATSTEPAPELGIIRAEIKPKLKDSEIDFEKLYYQLLDEFNNIQKETRRIRSHFPDPRRAVL